MNRLTDPSFLQNEELCMNQIENWITYSRDILKYQIMMYIYLDN